MFSQESPEAPNNPTRPAFQLVMVAAMLMVCAAVGAFVLIRWGGLAPGLQIMAPLATLGLCLVAWNPHWALCFAAFAITPLGTVQWEVLGVTLNLPEFVILALAAREGASILTGRYRLAAHLPWKSLLLLAATMLIGLGTGILNHNGLMRPLQDFRQFAEFILLFWLVLQRVQTTNQVLQVAGAYVAGASVIAIHGITQHIVPFGMTEGQIRTDLELYNSIRSSSFYGATPLGGLMVLAVGPALGMLLTVRGRASKALLLTAVILCLIAMVFTKTRGSWLGMAVALAFLFVWIRPNRKITLGIVGVGMVLALISGPMVISRLATLANPKEDVSLMERAQYYAAATRIAQAHPMLGLGWGCYYEIDDIIRAGAYVETPRPEGAEDATVHSAYLQILVKTGALGILGFLGVMLVWLERLWRVYRTTRRDRKAIALFAGITAGLTGYLFHSTFENFFQWPVMAQSFWLLLGLSFVMSGILGGERRFMRVPMAIIGTAVALFTLFLAASIQLETAHTSHFKKNVAAAIAAGDLDEALRIATWATEVRYDDPLTYVVYAEALLRAGDDIHAQQALDAAMSVGQKPYPPDIVNTDAGYYYAPARLVRGRLYFEAGDLRSAIAEFELARAYADLRDPEFAEFHPLLYECYAAYSLWSRALQFGAPTDDERATLEPERALRLAYTCEALGNWELLQSLIPQLESTAAHTGDVYYLQGRAAQQDNDVTAAIANFQSALSAGHSRAAYFLGMALAASGQSTDAINILTAIAPDDDYYAIAMAQALVLHPSVGATPGLPDVGDLQARLTAALTAMTPVSEKESAERSLRSFQRIGTTTAHDGPVDLVLLWATSDGTTASIGTVTRVDNDTAFPTYRLGDSGALLQLQHAENRLVDPALFPFSKEVGPLPGWIDCAHDWFDLRMHYTAVVTDEADRTALRIPGLAWFNAPPVPLIANTRYLLTGTLRSGTGDATYGWQRINADSTVLERHTLLETSAAEGIASGTTYISTPNEDEALRVQLVVGVDSTAYYSDMALLPISPPPTP